jgi:hypothetical protein
MTAITIMLSVIAIIVSWCSLLDLWDSRRGKKSETERNEDKSENP